ncbi:hypothetical protein ACH41H_48965 [Streptomyces sp. NPDC020800]|uniref:hypothetical protein n=1 Tax=Streptomyces sp. NPDC020800 TaxID=3365092 RepID=UPI0037B903A6
MTPAVAAGEASNKLAVTGFSSGRPDQNTPWSPENDEASLNHRPVRDAGTPGRAITSGLQLSIAAPTRRYCVGMVGLHLVDKSRPYVPGNRRRGLMVSLWYPAATTSGHCLAPRMPSVSGTHFLSVWGLTPQQVYLPKTASHVLAPVNTKLGELPVLLHSTGLHQASYGYLVVTVDHTHDAGEVQFPGQRLEVTIMPSHTHASNTLKVRAANIRFVLDRLAEP